MCRENTLVLILLVASTSGCGPAETSGPTTPPVRPAAAEEPEPPPEVEVVDGGEPERRCLPVVSGCGCTYACGESLRDNADGTYDVMLDGGTTTASIERWCFDGAGLGNPEDSAGPGQNCKDVFYDRSPCGGECIPTLEFLTCRVQGDRCAP